MDEPTLYAAFTKFMKKYEDDKAAALAADEDAKKKAAAAGSGGQPAGYQAPSPPPPPPPPAAPAVATAPELAQYAATVADLRKRLDDETAARVSTECRAMLDPLKPMLKFNYEKELGVLLTAKDSAARAAHVAYMAETYQTLPGTTGMIPVYEGAAPSSAVNDPTKAPANHEAILTYMRQHPGMDYEHAAAKLTAAK